MPGVGVGPVGFAKLEVMLAPTDMVLTPMCMDAGKMEGRHIQSFLLC